MTKQIEHVFPMIGKQTIQIFGQAEQLHNWMEESKIIDRLAQNPQLGMANIHFPEFRHTRLDYTYLILLIIDILKQHSAEFRFNLSARKKYTIGTTKYNWTGAEMLQCWVLLLNMGHMHGTFFSESILHRHFKKHWKEISKHLKRQWTRSLGKEFLEDSDYRFYQLLTLFELESLPLNSLLYKPFAGLIGIYSGSKLKSMGVKVSTDTEYLRNIYKVIRKIAFLSLDSHYSRCPFGVTLSKLISILPTFIYKTLDGDKSIDSQLRSLDYWMSNHYYCSPLCVITMLDNTHSLNNNYKKSIKRSLIDNRGDFLSLIKSWKKDTKTIIPATDWIHVIRVPIDANRNNIDKHKLFPVNIRVPLSKPEYRLSVINVSANNYYLDIFAKHTPDPYRVLALIPQSGLLNIFAGLKEDDKYCYSEEKETSTQYRERWRIIRHYCSDHLYAYIDTIFKLLAKKDEVIQFKPVKGKGLGWLFCNDSQDVKKDIDEYLESDFRDYSDNVSPDEAQIRKRELIFTKDVVLKHLRCWGSAAIYTGGVDVYNPKIKKDNTDIDGIALLIKGKDVRLLLLQNKETHKSRIGGAIKWFNKLKTVLPNIKGTGKYKIHKYKAGIAISIDFKL